MSISEPFVRRPVGTALLTIAIALAGALAFFLLPVSPLPQVEFPTIQVSAGLPGASPETMASAVATPLERQFGRIAGVTEMTSTSSLGSASIVLQFDLSRDINGAARDVQAAINAARGQLPSNLPNNPTYRKVNPADAPIMIISLTSDTMDTSHLYDAASSILQQKLSQVEGVGQVTVGGSSLPAVRVELDPRVLNHYGIGMEQVRTVLGNSNANRPKGQLTDSTKTWQLSTNDQLLAAKQYRPLIISYKQGAAVRLSDVGDVEDSVQDLRNAGLANGKPGVSVVMFRQTGANIIDTVDRIYDLMPQLKAAIPPAIQLTVMMDRTTTIRASVKDIEFTLLVSIALVVLVVFLFLRNWRATIIPGIAIPVSLLGTFGVMYLLGYSVDNLSLMALTISTGFVVDDAIVVIENITRYLEKGLSPFAAAVRGAREIGFTVLSMSVSLVAVFIPILLMGGIVGRLFREFAVTLSIAIAVSLLISLTTTPMMCAKFLKSHNEIQHGRLYQASETAFDWIHRKYETGLSWVLNHQRLTLTLTLITICLNIFLYMVVPKGFFPDQDTGRLTGTVQAAQSNSFQSLKDKTSRFVQIVMADPAVDAVVSFTGGGGANTARMFIALKPLNERKVSANQVIARLRGKLSNIPGANLYLQPVQDIRVGGRASNAALQYTLQGDNLAELNYWAPLVAQKMMTLPQLADVNSDQQNGGLDARLVIDRDTASRLGISTRLIDDTLYDSFGQRLVSTLYTQLNQYHVVMEVAPRFWQSPETLKEIYVHSSTGAVVPLSAFTHFEESNTPLAVNHQGQFPSVTLSFNLAPGVALGDAVQVIENTEHQMGLPASIRASFQGTAQAFQVSLSNEPLLILAALITVYIVLGVLYESTIHPITILSTLPSAGVGAIVALLICRTELSVIAVIGIILLIGIVKKNAIMMIDFALEAERKEGKSPRDSIYEACLLRFRPIMMTTMAALLAGLPLALGTGVGSELRRPLGISIVGGLMVSQMLTLFTTPVIYLYMERLRVRLAGWKPAVINAGQRSALIIFLFCILFSGCSVGPKYQRPTVEVPAHYKEDSTGQDLWKPAAPSDAVSRGKWWELYGDQQLNSLEERVSVSNQSLKAAEAQYRQAWALVRQNRADYFPTITTSPSITTSHASENRSLTFDTSGNTAVKGNSTNYILPVDLTYEVDLWGRVRNEVSASKANAQASEGDLENVRLSLQAELASDYFLLRALDAQKQLSDSTVQTFEKALQLTRNRHDQGIATGADVALAETQLETTRAEAIDVGVQRAQTEHAIAVLVGQSASEFSIAPDPLQGLPPATPSGLPSQLLERRPDIAASERRVAAANAQIGVAQAAFFPSLVLNATGGFQSSSIANWFSWPSRIWSLGPALFQTIFDAGKRHAISDQAWASYDQSVANYRENVLSAFQDVEDNLAQLRILEDEAKVQDDAVQAAQRSVQISNNRYENGITTYLEVLTAQSALLTNQRTALEILQRRMSASVLLIKALGGSWA